MVNFFLNTGRAKVGDTDGESFTSAVLGRSSCFELDTHGLFHFWRAFEMVLQASLSGHDFFLREGGYVVDSREPSDSSFDLQELVRLRSFSFLSLALFSDSLAVIFTLSAVLFLGDRAVT